MKNIKFASREHKEKTVIDIRGVKVGCDFIVIAGPCSVEDEEQMMHIARAVKEAGADGLIVEVHSQPEKALSDGNQTLSPEQFSSMAKKVLSLRMFMEDLN